MFLHPLFIKVMIMADQKPIYAGKKPNGTFVYAKEFGDDDQVDSSKISYDPTGNTYLTSNNISSNLDTIDATFTAWQSAKTLTTFKAYLTTAVEMSPCDTDILMPFNSVARDSDSGWNGTTHKYTVQKTGYYQIEASIKFKMHDVVNNFWAQYQTKIYVDDVYRVGGMRQAAYANQALGSNEELNDPLRPVQSLEYLTSGQTISIYAMRFETNRPASPTYACATEDIYTSLQEADGVSYTDIVNFLSIDMVYA
jgi:hypothetical protein